MLKKIALMAGMTVTLAGNATAADLPSKAPYISSYNWTGCSLGVHAGGGWTQNTATVPGVTTFDTRASGWLGGGQAGCDYQVESWVFGIEGRFSAANMAGHAAIDPLSLASIHLNEIATGTARIGYAIDRVLPYAKAGFAWGNSDKISLGASNGLNSFVGGGSALGWTAGVGVEVAFMPNWSWKVEYDHMDLGVNGYTLNCQTCGGGTPPATLNVGQRIDTVVLGLNYRFH